MEKVCDRVGSSHESLCLRVLERFVKWNINNPETQDRDPSQAPRLTLVIPALTKQKQKDEEFKVITSHIASLRPCNLAP